MTQPPPSKKKRHPSRSRQVAPCTSTHENRLTLIYGANSHGDEQPATVRTEGPLQNCAHLAANLLRRLSRLVVDKSHNLVHFTAGALHFLVVEICVLPDRFDLVPDATPAFVHCFRCHRTTSLGLIFRFALVYIPVARNRGFALNPERTATTERGGRSNSTVRVACLRKKRAPERPVAVVPPGIGGES